MAYQQGVQGTPVSLPNLMPQAPSWQAWGPSMINPNGPSSNYPMNPGYVSGGYDGR